MKACHPCMVRLIKILSPIGVNHGDWVVTTPRFWDGDSWEGRMVDIGGRGGRGRVVKY